MNANVIERGKVTSQPSSTFYFKKWWSDTPSLGCRLNNRR